MPTFRIKILYLVIFWNEILKTFVIFEISTFNSAYLQNFEKKQKYQNLAQKSLIWEFWTVILKESVIFEISTLDLPNGKIL